MDSFCYNYARALRWATAPGDVKKHKRKPHCCAGWIPVSPLRCPPTGIRAGLVVNMYRQDRNQILLCHARCDNDDLERLLIGIPRRASTSGWVKMYHLGMADVYKKGYLPMLAVVREIVDRVAAKVYGPKATNNAGVPL